MKRIFYPLISILLLIGLACNLAQVAAPAEESTPAPFSPSASPPEHTSVATSQPTLPPGTVYYVSPDGDDANPGTEDRPWRTIQKAAQTLSAGETVYLRAGTYAEQLVPQNDGNEGKPITYAAYPGETVTIDGSSVTVPEYSGLIDLSGRSYIIIQGLRVIHSNQAGIYADGSSHIRIEGNYTYDTYSSGIGVWSSREVIVAGNEVILGCNDGGQENITIGGTDTFEVYENHVHDGGPGTNGGEGIDIKDGSSNGRVYFNHVHHLVRLGIYLDAWDKHTHDIEVFGNIVHDTQNDGFTLASEMGGLLERIRLYNNIAYNNRFLGINLSQNGDSATHPMRDIQLINNTVVGNGSGDWGGGISIDSLEIEQVIVRNNIVSGNLSFQIVVGPGVPQAQVTIDHNLIDSFRGYEGEVHGTEVVEGDPRFFDPQAADFHLQNDSPAIDRGAVDSAPSQDMDGDLRPQDGDGDGDPAVDIGADEVVSAGGTLQRQSSLCADP